MSHPAVTAHIFPFLVHPSLIPLPVPLGGAAPERCSGTEVFRGMKPGGVSVPSPSLTLLSACFCTKP